MKIAAIFLSAFCAAALGIPLGDHVQHEKREAHPLLRKSTVKVDGGAIIPARIALKQRNLEHGMKLLLGVSDPSSPNYGKHYTSEEVTELFAPDDASIDKVTQWLKDAGINNVSVPKSRGFVDFKTTADKLESLLQTKYHIYDHTKTGAQQMGADAYHLPRAISEVVDFVAPGIVTGTVQKREEPKPRRVSRFKPLPGGKAATGCDTVISPQCIADKYKIPQATLNATSNRLGIYESDSEMHQQSDLDAFYQAYASNIPQGTGPVIDLIDWNGAQPDPSQAVGEAALDFDMAIPIIYPQQTEVFQTKDNYSNQTPGFLNVFLDAIDGSYCTSTAYGETGDDPNVDGTTQNEMCGKFTPTNVISLSYGLTEASWPVNYQKRQCDEYMKLGLQGVTIVFSSGDGGVAGGHGGDCQGSNGDIFNPAAPGSCPYVTSVGATYIPKGNSLDDTEVAVASFGSGGGFSNIWEQPDYQKDAVSSWFKNSDPGFPNYSTKDGVVPTDGGIYNKAGRGFPDVSALGDNGAVVFNGKKGTSGGTSMSAPIFAAIINRINEERIANSKKPLGFINPALYKNPSMFNDVTSGDQSGGDGNCNGKGFSAASGWDPVTGLGTPKYPEMLAYLKDL
ncbi:Peptidase S8/S53, subtilisin/kexin/sedolisin [Cordyceps fumosorosea ARSEF 2679]|uniref:Peptidase S8/S53, subtilisin/kexin/sedolisin n=1 Tax=Cordyceps fumosorosea (strain ARSEF 2679) TaxID=1081104 RepID=A0A167PLA5_CORFA|nr:Peptidase S8/S53, subtilisin/kexin/sedolisin [Cordyceps fumosorosea ARSEF 2679]OAA56776.1 Peptidase S8/S53, subtilisin/kexin/sedolisin [Cordyceps fumosorosea ARSEF 2679]